MDRRPWSSLSHGEGGEADTTVNLMLVGFNLKEGIQRGEPEPQV